MEKDCKCIRNAVTVEPITDQPIDNLESAPDFLLAERIVPSQDTGQKKSMLTRVPYERIAGNGRSLDNVTTLTPNNEINVPEKMVLAAAVRNAGSYNVVELTTATSKPDFLILGKLADQVLVQSTGFIDIIGGHQFIVGADYYSGEDGLPTTNAASGYKIFKPISETKLMITLGQ